MLESFLAYISILCLSRYKADYFLYYLFIYIHKLKHLRFIIPFFVFYFNSLSLLHRCSYSHVSYCALKIRVWESLYLSVHILCLNDCILPIHLNSILHITSTLIWAVKCAVLSLRCFLFGHRWTPINPWTSTLLLRWQNGFCCWIKLSQKMLSFLKWLQSMQMFHHPFSLIWCHQ